MITVYGASDDLIEVEGEVEEEFYCDESGTILLIGSSGAVVEVYVELESEWSATARIRRPGPRGNKVIVTTIPRPGEHGEDGDMAVAITGLGTPLVYKVQDL